jgi:Mrp family chromosome partitioning ATPase/capsular polysaccharide biosynthesis protein
VTEGFANRPATLADYAAILRRRKWIILALPVVAALSAYAVSATQSSLYKATATVLVNRTSIVSAIANVSDPAIGDPSRFLATQASVARSPVLAGRVVRAAHVPGASAGSLLGSSSVSPETNADLLDISVSWSSPDGAVRLANAYAQGYTRYKTELDTKRIDDALATLRRRIETLKSSGATSSPSYSTLLEYQSQLETIGTLLANNTSVLKPAESAAKVRPRPMRRAILGGLLGIVLGVGLAFLAEALDRRVRSEEELEQALRLPLIGRVPKPPRHLSDVNELVMIAEPESIEAESIRRLKTSIEFLNLDRAARTIMVTSAVPREGKSTTIANLAIAFARSGRRVALVDLDIRRPFLHRFFHIGLGLGMTDIVAGAETVAGALRPLALPGAIFPGAPPSRNGKRSHSATEVSEAVEGKATLSLLPAGTGSATGAESLSDFLESDRLSAVLDELADQFDVVLVDTPPLLAVGDAMALTAKVDALVLVLHAGLQRPLVHELARQLHSSQAPTLGFVLTGVTPGGDGYGSGYGYDAYIYGAPRKKTERRVGRS